MLLLKKNKVILSLSSALSYIMNKLWICNAIYENFLKSK